MTYKEIKRTADKFIKAVNGKIDFVSVENFLKAKGYSVIFYNTPVGDRIIEKFGLCEKAQKTSAFTYSGTGNIVFIDNNVSSEDKNYLLYHETGHILLGHTDYARISTKNRYAMEFEADTFAQIIINPPKTKKTVVINVLALIVLLVISFNIGTFTANKDISLPVYNNVESYSEDLTSEYVYITATGKKYHRSNCRYVQNKSNISFLNKKEAAKTHSPCSVCNP